MPAQPQSEQLPVASLEFDPENPRFFSQAEGLTDLAVVHRMLEKEKILELVLSIGEKGFYEGEPLLVVPAKPGKFTVVEGNRRLAALKILSEPKLVEEIDKKAVSLAIAESNADVVPKKVPCLIFAERKDTLQYLGFRHITGTKPWGPLAKAKFLRQLEETLPSDLPGPEKLRSLAKTIGSNPKTVRELLIAYEFYKLIEERKFFGIEDLNRESLEFGVFYTATKDGTILGFLGKPQNPEEVSTKVDTDKLEELTRWIFERTEDPITGKLVTRLGESRNLVSLSRVLRNEVALNAFRTTSISLKLAADMAGEQLENFEKACGATLEHIKQAAALVNEVGEKLEKQHTRLTSLTLTEAEDLNDRVKKKVRINEKAE